MSTENLSTAEMREKATDELQNLEADMRRELWKTRFENFTNQLDNTARVQKLRRGVARVKTLLTERAIEDGSVLRKSRASKSKRKAAKA